MISNKLFILCAFAFVLIGMTVAFDYEEGDDSGGSDDGSVDESYGAVDGGGGGGGDYETDGGDGGDYAAAGEESDDSAAASQPIPQMVRPKFNRQKRSLNTEDSKRVLRRVRRGGHGRVGPVYTYQKTDHHANFKWGNY